MKNFRIKVIIGFTIFALIFFAIDWVTKHYLFNGEYVNWNNGGSYINFTEKNYEVLGVRSVAHDNSTIFSALSLTFPDWVHYSINFIIALVFAFIPFFSKSLFLGLACGIIFGGIMGNSLDKSFSATSEEYYQQFFNKTFVRDIFYIPWLDRGTFNFADVAIIVGSGLLIIHIIISNIREYKKEKLAKKHL